jgi:hypothetical protein
MASGRMSIRKFSCKIKVKSSCSLRLTKAVDNDVDLMSPNGIQEQMAENR